MDKPLVWKKGDKNIPIGAVYVGRPSEFGNPFVMKKESDRDTVCDKFEEYILNKPELIQSAKDKLKGKHLVCFCSPKRCHADTLLRIANE